MPSSPISPCPLCPPHAAGGHGCAVYSSSVTDAEWAILEPLLPAPGSTAGRGGRPEKHCRRAIVDVILYIVRGATAGGVPASRDGVRGLRPLGPQRGAAAHPRRAARPTAGAGRAAPVPDRGDHRLADGTRRRHRAPIQPRLGWRQQNERRQAPHRRGCERPAARRRRHRRLDPGPRRRTPTPGRTARQLLHHPAGLGRRRLPGRLLIWAKDVLTLTMQIIKRIPGATGFHVRPRIWVVERSFAWINKHRRCVRDYETRPDHHEAMLHLAMITTMTRRLART